MRPAGWPRSTRVPQQGSFLLKNPSAGIAPSVELPGWQGWSITSSLYQKAGRCGTATTFSRFATNVMSGSLSHRTDGRQTKAVEATREGWVDSLKRPARTTHHHSVCIW